VSREAIRNICIVVALALFMMTATGAFAGAIVGLLLRILLLAAILYVMYMLYREHKHELEWMPSRQRNILRVGGVVLAVLVIAGLLLPTTNGLQSLMFLVLTIGLGIVLWKVWSDGRRYY
jgi:4-hydroxybenzoate polyprenyltransferase